MRKRQCTWTRQPPGRRHWRPLEKQSVITKPKRLEINTKILCCQLRKVGWGRVERLIINKRSVCEDTATDRWSKQTSMLGTQINQIVAVPLCWEARNRRREERTSVERNYWTIEETNGRRWERTEEQTYGRTQK